jgi:peptidoglycan/LPS O-acetylase OafA/YrhL
MPVRHGINLKQYFDKTLVFAVPGFFLLSAFLLTYRLLLELFNYKLTEFKPILKLLDKYAIRRFFPIYPLLVIFIVLIKCLIFASPNTYTRSIW